MDEIDYPEEEEQQQEQEYVLGGQMWEQVEFRNVELDLDITTSASGEMIPNPENRFKVNMKEAMDRIIGLEQAMQSYFRQNRLSLEGHYFLTDDDRAILVQSMKKIKLIGFKNPWLYVFGYMQARQEKPLLKQWFAYANEEINPVNVFMYSRYWRKILF